MLEEKDNLLEWLSLEWFNLSTLGSYDWVFPAVLYALPVVPLLFILKWLFTLNTRNKLNVAMFDGKLSWQWTSLLRFIPDILFILFIMLVLVALARPQRINEQVELTAEGIDII